MRVIVSIIVSKHPFRRIPSKLSKMSSPLLPGSAIGGGKATPPSSRSSSPMMASSPAPRVNAFPAEGNFTGHSEARMLKNMYDAITELDLWDWLRTFTPEKDKGFMWSPAPEIGRISHHPKVDSDGHSGASFAFCMRHMEMIAKEGWHTYYRTIIAPAIAKKLA
jgi:hypothetical protein